MAAVRHALYRKHRVGALFGGFAKERQSWSFDSRCWVEIILARAHLKTKLEH